MNNICFTVRHDLCLGCGICSDACPTHSIQMVIANGEYRPVVNSMTCINDKGCHRCSTVCPGLGVKLNEIGEHLFQYKGLAHHHKLVGFYHRAYFGYALDENTRYHGASGGLLTAFLSFLLDNGYISAAVVAGNDLTQPFLNRAVLVHSSADLTKARSSKYCPVKFDGIVDQVKAEVGKVAIVGLPCVIHGFRKLETNDRKFKEQIWGYLGLYCSCNRTFNLTEYVFKKQGINQSDLTYFQYRDEGCLGSMVVKQRRSIRIADSNSETALYKKDIVYKEQYQNYYHPLRSFFIPNRCQFCIDHYAELADVSFGDIHYGKYKEDKIGVNSIVVRNVKFDALLEEAGRLGYLKITPLSEEELVKCQASAPKKKGRVGGVLRFAKAIGKTIPQYDVVITKYTYWKSIAYYLFAKSQMFVGKRRWLWWIIPLLAKKGKVT